MGTGTSLAVSLFFHGMTCSCDTVGSSYNWQQLEMSSKGPETDVALAAPQNAPTFKARDAPLHRHAEQTKPFPGRWGCPRAVPCKAAALA